jgi:putative OPT family oligopeptide transporter
MFGGGSSSEDSRIRTDRDLPLKFVLGFVAVIAFAIYALPQIPLSLLGTFLVVMFTFFFVTVSSRIVGLVGSSSNPASGMTIATLLATTFILAAAGYSGQEGAIAAISIGAIVCIGICIAGDTSQDLKTGYLLGATPSKQQIGELIGVLGSALFIGLTISILHTSYGIGSKELAAPQATLMKLVVEGVLEQSLPWGFVIFGAVCAAVVELMGIGSLPFAIGLYLPIHLSTPIMLGAIIRWIFDEFSTLATKVKNGVRENGILFASGLIAGDALVGVMLAPLYHYHFTPARILGWWSENKVVNNEMFFRSADTASLIPFLFIIASLCLVLFNPSKESLEDLDDEGLDIYYPPEELEK